MKKKTYCPYHKKTKLDSWGECDKCEIMIMNYGKTRRLGWYNAVLQTFSHISSLCISN